MIKIIECGLPHSQNNFQSVYFLRAVSLGNVTASVIILVLR